MSRVPEGERRLRMFRLIVKVLSDEREVDYAEVHREVGLQS